MWRYNVFDLSRDQVIDVPLDFVGGVPLSQVTNELNLSSIGLVKMKIMAFIISVSVPIPILRLQC